MERPLDSAQERQPLLELQRHEAETPAAAPQQPAAGAPPESADAAPAASQPPALERLLSERRCRYCLQEEEPDNALEAPCKCAGSIKVRGIVPSRRGKRPSPAERHLGWHAGTPHAVCTLRRPTCAQDGHAPGFQVHDSVPTPAYLPLRFPAVGPPCMCAAVGG